MNAKTRKKLEAAGFAVGGADKFLGLSACESKPITWRGRNLSVDSAIVHYRGRLQIDSVRGAACLLDLQDSPLLDEVLQSGNYEVELVVIKRIS